MNLPYCLRSHTPIRPIWICRTCAGPWPCATARLSLKGEYADNRPGLSIYMATVLHEAVADLHKLNPAELDLAAMFARFIGWTKWNGLGTPRPPAEPDSSPAADS